MSLLRPGVIKQHKQNQTLLRPGSVKHYLEPICTVMIYIKHTFTLEKHISSLILFKLYRNFVFVKILPDFGNGLCSLQKLP